MQHSKSTRLLLRLFAVVPAPFAYWGIPCAPARASYAFSATCVAFSSCSLLALARPSRSSLFCNLAMLANKISAGIVSAYWCSNDVAWMAFIVVETGNVFATTTCLEPIAGIVPTMIHVSFVLTVSITAFALQEKFSLDMKAVDALQPCQPRLLETSESAQDWAMKIIVSVACLVGAIFMLGILDARKLACLRSCPWCRKKKTASPTSVTSVVPCTLGCVNPPMHTGVFEALGVSHPDKEINGDQRHCNEAEKATRQIHCDVTHDGNVDSAQAPDPSGELHHESQDQSSTCRAAIPDCSIIPFACFGEDCNGSLDTAHASAALRVPQQVSYECALGAAFDTVHGDSLVEVLEVGSESESSEASTASLTRKFLTFSRALPSQIYHLLLEFLPVWSSTRGDTGSEPDLTIGERIQNLEEMGRHNSEGSYSSGERVQDWFEYLTEYSTPSEHSLSSDPMMRPL